jgi:hypothetical protein
VVARGGDYIRLTVVTTSLWLHNDFPAPALWLRLGRRGGDGPSVREMENPKLSPTTVRC